MTRDVKLGSKIGRVNDYVPKQQIIQAHSPVIIPDVAAIKFYSLFGGTPFNRSTLEKAKRFVASEFADRSKPYRTGFGFSILSDGVLNISVWGGREPSLISPSVYTFTSLDNISEELRGINNCLDNSNAKSPFCVWELGIVQHEAETWRRYLFSRRTNQDKVRYLNDTIEGLVGVEVLRATGKLRF